MVNIVILDLLGGIALMLWGLHSSVAYPVLESAGELEPSRLRRLESPPPNLIAPGGSEAADKPHGLA